MSRAFASAALLLAGCSMPREAVREPARVPEAVTVSTNEPFFSATVAQGAITITGVDTAPRRLRVVETHQGDGTRSWAGKDALGSVRVTVVAHPCSDDMSGAAFPFSGWLQIGERSARGCGYPAGSPPPRPD